MEHEQTLPWKIWARYAEAHNDYKILGPKHMSIYWIENQNPMCVSIHIIDLEDPSTKWQKHILNLEEIESEKPKRYRLSDWTKTSGSPFFDAALSKPFLCQCWKLDDLWEFIWWLSAIHTLRSSRFFVQVRKSSSIVIESNVNDHE